MTSDWVPSKIPYRFNNCLVAYDNRSTIETLQSALTNIEDKNKMTNWQPIKSAPTECTVAVSLFCKKWNSETDTFEYRIFYDYLPYVNKAHLERQKWISNRDYMTDEEMALNREWYPILWKLYVPDWPEAELALLDGGDMETDE